MKPLYPYGKGRELLDAILPNAFYDALDRLGEDRWATVSAAVWAMAETLERLESRYFELVAAMHAISDAVLSDDEEELHALQLQLVDKTEAFHQHVYAGLSSFMRFAALVASHGAAKGIRFGSVDGFLRKAQSLGLEEDCCAEIEVLRKSIEFRNKFVTHPQQSSVYTWFTFGMDGYQRVVYFIRGENATRRSIYRETQSIDPDGPGYAPPVACKHWFCPPRVEYVREGLVHFAKQMLAYLVRDPDADIRVTEPSLP